MRALLVLYRYDAAAECSNTSAVAALRVQSRGRASTGTTTSCVRVPGWTAFSMADVHPDGGPWLHSPSASPRDGTPTNGEDEDTTIENSDGDHSMDDDDSGSVDGKPKPDKIAPKPL